jgi:hypothetical protein
LKILIESAIIIIIVKIVTNNIVIVVENLIVHVWIHVYKIRHVSRVSIEQIVWVIGFHLAENSWITCVIHSLHVETGV